MKEYCFEMSRALVPFIVGYALTYLVSSFVSISFDPREWTQDARIVAALFGLCIGCALWVNMEVRREI